MYLHFPDKLEELMQTLSEIFYNIMKTETQN
jgi:hypothetical protein